MILFTHTDIFKIYMYLITRNSNLMKDITNYIYALYKLGVRENFYVLYIYMHQYTHTIINF